MAATTRQQRRCVHQSYNSLAFLFASPIKRLDMADTVLVAMSGGVDSSVAAALLVERGYRVIGATIKTFCYSDLPTNSRTCCGLDGIMDARAVCDRLGIPHYVFDMEEGFTRDVIDDFVAEYAAGRTPNPCVRCNSNTKIPDLLKKARALGADWIATGHYARIERSDNAVRLLRGLDREKDQAYFLWGVPYDVLSRLLFPVGELTKTEVRARARELGLVTADKPESQEICFVPRGHYTDFLAQRLGSDHPALQPGPIIDRRTGRVLGEHQGYAHFTVGQRRGLPGGQRRPLRVLAVVPEQRAVVVGTDDELVMGRVVVSDLNWLPEAPRVGDCVTVQMRHRAAAVPGTVVDLDSNTLIIDLDHPVPAVAPGQSAVLFVEDQVLGGGRIHRTDSPPAPCRAPHPIGHDTCAGSDWRHQFGALLSRLVH